MFRDETATGRALAKSSRPVLPDRTTALELVRLRVREEVARHNASPAPYFRGLVTPTDAESVGDRQFEDLDTEIDLTVDPVWRTPMPFWRGAG
ncbi:hypothetical protein ACQP2K_30270 [Microbispora siamensis]